MKFKYWQAFEEQCHHFQLTVDSSDLHIYQFKDEPTRSIINMLADERTSISYKLLALAAFARTLENEIEQRKKEQEINELRKSIKLIN